MGLKVSGKFGVIFLVILNTLFLILGLAMLICGIVFKTNATIITTELEPVLDKVQLGSFTLYTLADSASIVMICAGVFISVIAAMGCIGALCKIRFLLVIYAIIVLIIAIIELAGVILWFQMRDWLTSEVKTQMKTLLDDNYKGNTDQTNPISVSFNLLFKTMECCGVDAVTASNNDFDNTTWWGDAARGSDLMPKWCCTASTAESISNDTFTDILCPQSLGNYYTSGCFDKVVSVVTEYSGYFIGIGITIIIVELLAVVFAFCVCRQAGDDDK